MAESGLLLSYGTRDGFIKVFDSQSLDTLTRSRVHKAKVQKMCIVGWNIYSVGEDQKFIDFDMRTNQAVQTVDLRKGVSTMALNSSMKMAGLAKLNGVVDFYSTDQLEQSLYRLDFSDRINPYVTSMAWGKKHKLYVALEDGVVEQFDMRNLSTALSSLKIEGRPNDLLKLSSEDIVIATDRIEIYNPDLQLQEVVEVGGGNGQSLKVVAEDVSRGCIVVGGFDQKIHVAKLRSKL